MIVIVVVVVAIVAIVAVVVVDVVAVVLVLVVVAVVVIVVRIRVVLIFSENRGLPKGTAIFLFSADSWKRSLARLC